MVILIVAIVFLSPVLAIALILWFRMRKARMLNETMLKLAEKGVVPPAEAMNTLAGGNIANYLAAGPRPRRSTSRQSRSVGAPRGPTCARA